MQERLPSRRSKITRREQRKSRTAKRKRGAKNDPPRLEIPQERRDSYFPTAPATAAHPLPPKLNGQTSYDHPCEFGGRSVPICRIHQYLTAFAHCARPVVSFASARKKRGSLG